MDKTESSQSLVRTDFTLKYYQLEELLKEHSKLKVTGAESNVFVRSWIDYSLVRGDSIIHWREGSFESFLVIISEFFERSFTDADALTAFFKDSEQYKAITFVVSAETVPAQELDTLLSLLDSLQCFTESKVIEKGSLINTPEIAVSVNDEDADVTLEKQPIANKVLQKQFSSKVVLCITAKESELSEYSSTLKNFSVAFELGGKVQAKPVKKSKAPILISLVLLISAGTGLWFDFSEEADQSVTVQVNASVDTANEEAVNEVKITNKTSDNPALLGVDADLVVKQTAVAQDIGATSLMKPMVKQETVDRPEKLQPLQNNVVKTQESLTKNTVNKENANLAQTEDKPKELPESLLKKELEQVSIVEVSSAKVINIGSSINTENKNRESVSLSDKDNGEGVDSKNIDAEITELVDAWMKAWQSQNFENYSQFYSENFKGKHASHKKWLSWRKKRIEKPKWIKLSRSNIKRLSNGSKEYSVSLTLNYVSPRYKDKTFKRITFDQSALGFKISKEENLKVTKLK